MKTGDRNHDHSGDRQKATKGERRRNIKDSSRFSLMQAEKIFGGNSKKWKNGKKK